MDSDSGGLVKRDWCNQLLKSHVVLVGGRNMNVTKKD